MFCPSCGIEVDDIEKAVEEMFRNNGFKISKEALRRFLELVMEHFGEISYDDVDALCHFVEKNFGVREIERRHVEAYFEGF